MKTEDYLDMADTFKNTLITQSNRILKLYDKFEINAHAHISNLKDKEQIKSWNMIVNNIEEVAEVIELLILDLENYDKLWHDYLDIEE